MWRILTICFHDQHPDICPIAFRGYGVQNILQVLIWLANGNGLRVFEPLVNSETADVLIHQSSVRSVQLRAGS